MLPGGAVGEENRVEAGDGHGTDTHEKTVDVGDVNLAIRGVEDGGGDERHHEKAEEVDTVEVEVCSCLADCVRSSLSRLLLLPPKRCSRPRSGPNSR